MKEKMTIEYSDSDFRLAIEERFLYDNAQSSSQTIEAAVRQALWLLWDTVEIQFFGYRYDNHWIRKNLLETLTPDLIEFSVRSVRYGVQIGYAKELARMIFFFLIAGDEIFARHARGEFTRENFIETYRRFKSESEFQFGEQRYERRYKYAI